MNEARPKVVRLMEAASAATQDALPEESTLSFPLPLKRDTALIAALFGALALPTPDGLNATVYSPTLRVYVDWDTEASVGYETVAVTSDAPIGLLYRPELSAGPGGGNSEALFAAADELYALLEAAAALYRAGDSSPASQDIRTQTYETLRRLTSDAIWPHYEALSPDFIAWLLGQSPATDADGGTCPNCGAARTPDQRFCINCGQRF